MGKRLSSPLQLQETSHGHKLDNPDAETGSAYRLSVSKVLKRERAELLFVNYDLLKIDS